MSKVITYYSVKGGVGKTSLSYMTADYFDKIGKKVLLIDSDPQSSLSHSILKDRPDKTIFDSIFNHEPLPVTKINDNISIVYSDLNLLKIQTVNQNHFKSEIRKIKYFDYIIFDTPPTFNQIIQSVLFASDLLIIPSQISLFDLEVVDFVVAEAKNINPTINIKLLLNRVYSLDKYTNSEKEYLDLFANKYDDILLNSKIPDSKLIRNLIDRKEEIFTSSNKLKKGFADNFNLFVKEVA